MSAPNVNLNSDDAWAFVESLGDLTPESWSVVAGEFRARPWTPDATSVMGQLVRQHQADLLAWCLHDAVDTAAWLARRRGVREFPHNAASATALAVLLRPLLGERRFHRWYRLFARVVPDRQATVSRPIASVFTESLCATANASANVRQQVQMRRVP